MENLGSDLNIKNEIGSEAARPTPEITRRKSIDPTRLAGINVLLVEDVPDNQILLTLMLKSSGANVNIACTGKAAIEAALQGDFDVVLMDIQMPEIDGYEATKQLRERGFRKPII